MRSASAKFRASRAARRAAISCSISSTGTGGLLIFRPPERKDAQHPVEAIERLPHGRRASQAPSSPASMAEFSARTRSNITPMAAALLTSCLDVRGKPSTALPASASRSRGWAPAWQRIKAREKIRESLQRFLGLRHRGPRELELLPVVHAEIQVAQRRRTEPVIDDVLQVVDVAERLRHLLRPLGLVSGSDSIMRCSTCTQKRENCWSGRAFTLRDFVLVMRKNQVDAAGMNVDRRRPEQPQRHR